MKWLMEPVAVALGIIIVIVAVMLFGGFYLKTTQAPINPTPTPAPVTPVPTEIPTTVPETTPPTPEIMTPAPTPTKPQGNYVVPAVPFTDEKYYKLPYRSTRYDPRTSMLPPVIFHQTYDGKFQSEAIVVNLVRTPLMVDYSLSYVQSPTRSFFFLTIRDNATQELIAQDGFLGPYSEDRMKRLTFSSPGAYHINMYGGFVTVDLSIRAHKD